VLSPEKLAALLPSKIHNHSLFVFDELSSTNTFALELAKNPTPQGTVILADRQTAGRGRLKRSWFSPPGANIYGSLIFSFNSPIQTIGWVPLMAGVAIAQAIEDQAEIDITLKWPNDILIDERKVGGILCESFKMSSTETRVVIGFGINVNLSELAFPKDLQLIATSLQIQAQRPLDRHHLLKSIITTLEQGWEELISQGPQGCRLAYNSRCSTLGKQIQVLFPDGIEMEGMAQSIGEQGQLQMIPSPSDAREQSVRILNIHAGDIRHIRRKSNFL
jgi:BirA family biotin operon repressor/biotin-[acetyl-CoA-carboxylase] ligase